MHSITRSATLCQSKLTSPAETRGWHCPEPRCHAFARGDPCNASRISAGGAIYPVQEHIDWGIPALLVLNRAPFLTESPGSEILLLPLRHRSAFFHKT